jgi:hypothetical protein
MPLFSNSAFRTLNCFYVGLSGGVANPLFRTGRVDVHMRMTGPGVAALRAGCVSLQAPAGCGGVLDPPSPRCFVVCPGLGQGLVLGPYFVLCSRKALKKGRGDHSRSESPRDRSRSGGRRGGAVPVGRRPASVAGTAEVPGGWFLNPRSEIHRGMR